MENLKRKYRTRTRGWVRLHVSSSDPHTLASKFREHQAGRGIPIGQGILIILLVPRMSLSDVRWVVWEIGLASGIRDVAQGVRTT